MPTFELVPSHGLASHGLVRTAVRQDVSAECVCVLCACVGSTLGLVLIFGSDYGGVRWGLSLANTLGDTATWAGNCQYSGD